MSGRRYEVESVEWTKNQVLKTKSKVKLHFDQASCQEIGVGLWTDFQNVEGVSVIPFPTNDESAFYSDAMTFDDWVQDTRSETSTDMTRDMFRKIWNVVMAAVQQRDLGTPPYVRSEFLSKDRLADFNAWAYLKSGRPNPSSLLTSAVSDGGGSVAFDLEVGRHLKYLRDETASLLPSAIARKIYASANSNANSNAESRGEDDEDGDDEENEDARINFMMEREGEILAKRPKTNPLFEKDPPILQKFQIVLQPVRSASDGRKLGGFLLWIIRCDPNWSVDEGRRRLCDTIATHKESISKGKFPPKVSKLGQGLIDCVKELCTEDSEMLQFKHEDWIQCCKMYRFVSNDCAKRAMFAATSAATLANEIGTLTMDEEEEENGGVRRRNDSTAKPNKKSTRVKCRDDEKYKEQFGVEKVKEEYAFENVFTIQSAFHVASALGMDVSDAAMNKVKIKEKYDANGEKRKRVKISAKKTFSGNRPKNLTGSIFSLRSPPFRGDRLFASEEKERGEEEEEKEEGDSKNDDPFDKLYVMNSEDFYWSNVASGSGLKYTHFPWISHKDSPVYKTVNLNLPNSGKSKANSLKRTRELFSDMTLSSESDASDTSASASAHTGGNKRRRKNESETNFATSMDVKRASGRGLDFRQMTLLGKRYYSTEGENDGKRRAHVPMIKKKMTDDAKKDDVTLAKESFSTWRESLEKYANLAKDQATKGILIELDDREMHDVLVPNEFMKDFYAAQAEFEETAATHLLRIFKGGTESVMTVPGTHLASFYMERLHGRHVFKDKNLRGMYVNQTDFEGSLFSSFVNKRALELRYTLDVLSNWKEFMVIHYGCLDVYRHENDLHFAYMGSGEKSVGKSWLLSLLKSLFVEGTVRVYFGGSEKSDLVDLTQSDWIIIYDEMPPFLMGARGNTGLNKQGYSSDSSVNSGKTGMTSGRRVFLVFSFLDLPNGEKARISVYVNTPSVQVLLVVCNNKDQIDKAFKDRFYVSSWADNINSVSFLSKNDDKTIGKNFRESERNGTRALYGDDWENRMEAFDNRDRIVSGRFEKGSYGGPIRVDTESSSSEEERNGVGAFGLRSQRRTRLEKRKMNAETTSILDMESSLKAPDRNAKTEVSKFGFSALQTLHFVVEKSMAVGVLPIVDMTVATLILTKVLKYIESRADNISVMGLRSYTRTIREARTMVIEDAINNAFFSSCRDRSVIDEKSIACIKPYLFCQIQHAVFAITLLANQIVDPHYNAILYSAIKLNCNFPVSMFIAEKNKLADTISKREYVSESEGEEEGEEEEMEVETERRAQRRRTTTDLGAPISTMRHHVGRFSGVADDRYENGENGINDKMYPCSDKPGIPADVLILIDIFKNGYSTGTGMSDVSWRTVKERISRDDGKDVYITKYDLNYVKISSSGGSSNNVGAGECQTERKILSKMKDKISQSDLAEYLKKMSTSRVKVKYSAKPAEAEHLLSKDPIVKLNVENYEFPVVECIRETTTGTPIVNWYFCVHAINEFGSGKELIMEAIRSAVSYAGLRRRPRVITGFPEENLQNARFTYCSLEPTQRVKKFEIKSTSYQEREILAVLRFGESMMTRDADADDDEKGKSGDDDDGYGGPKMNEELKDIMNQVDESYLKPSVFIKEDLDDWIAERYAKSVGVPLAYYRCKSTGAIEPRWIFAAENGSVEFRPLPTMHNQSRRNVFFIEKNINGTKRYHENFFKEIGRECDYSIAEGYSIDSLPVEVILDPPNARTMDNEAY